MFANLENDRLEIVRENDQLTFMLSETPNSVIVDLVESASATNYLSSARLLYGGILFSVIFTQVICFLKFQEFFPPFAMILAVVGGAAAVSEVCLFQQRSTVSYWADVCKARTGPKYTTLTDEGSGEEACS